MHAGRAQQSGDVHERPAIFLAGRRIHDDVGAAIGQGGAKVARKLASTEAGAREKRSPRSRAASQDSRAARRESACIIENSNIKSIAARSMGYRFATAGARAPRCRASPRANQKRGRAGAHDHRRRAHRGRERDRVHGASNAEIKRDELSIFGDVLRYNAEFGRIEGDGGVRCSRAWTACSAAPAVQHARRYRRVRAARLPHAARSAGARQRRAYEFLARTGTASAARPSLPARPPRKTGGWRRRRSSSITKRRRARRRVRACASSTTR